MSSAATSYYLWSEAVNWIGICGRAGAANSNYNLHLWRRTSADADSYCSICTPIQMKSHGKMKKKKKNEENWFRHFGMPNAIKTSIRLPNRWNCLPDSSLLLFFFCAVFVGCAHFNWTEGIIPVDINILISTFRFQQLKFECKSKRCRMRWANNCQSFNCDGFSIEFQLNSNFNLILSCLFSWLNSFWIELWINVKLFSSISIHFDPLRSISWAIQIELFNQWFNAKPYRMAWNKKWIDFDLFCPVSALNNLFFSANKYHMSLVWFLTCYLLFYYAIFVPTITIGSSFLFFSFMTETNGNDKTNDRTDGHMDSAFVMAKMSLGTTLMFVDGFIMAEGHVHMFINFYQSSIDLDKHVSIDNIPWCMILCYEVNPWRKFISANFFGGTKWLTIYKYWRLPLLNEQVATFAAFETLLTKV